MITFVFEIISVIVVGSVIYKLCIYPFHSLPLL